MSAVNDHILHVSNLNVRLQNQDILDNITFSVKKGTTLAILGPNGAGKSVLFRVLLNLLPHEGKVEWAEKVKIGYVPQNVAVSDIPISVREFLSIGKNKCDPEAALSLVKLNNTKILEKRLGILSGGELRRVLIAWALIDDPNILLLDEPTTGVDVGSEEPIFLMLDGIKKSRKMTILLITHDIHIVQEYSDYLLALNKCVTFFGNSAGYLGSLMVLEKMALVGDALSHVALPGLAIGYLLNFNPFIGGFTFLFVSAVMIWYVQRITRISFEALVGASFTLALAVGIIIIPEIELVEALFGSIADVVILDAVVAAVISVVAVLLTRVIYKKLVLAMISEDLAISKGIDVAKTNLLYLFLVCTVVAVGIKIVGTLLVGFLVVVPAIAAKNLSSDMFRYALFGSVFGGISAFSGVLLANYFGLAPGPVVVFSGIAIFAVTTIVNWRLKITT